MPNPTTIEEVLEPYFTDGKGIAYSKRLSEALATIEQLVLERVIRTNIKVTEEFENRISDKLSPTDMVKVAQLVVEAQEQALTQLLRGGEK